MDDILHRLEKQLLKLIEDQKQLKQANDKLHKVKSLLSQEKDYLITKQQKAMLQIKTLVSKLKALERLP